MTFAKRQFPTAIVSSTVGTTLISVAAAWLMASPVLSTAVATPEAKKYEQTKPYKPSGRLYRLSPVPAGADWTS
jgi:hypothetical protein